jgi:short-subunit dehydrogenase
VAGSEGRWVLITGASAGIGRAAARAFVARGDRVIAVARRRENLDALCAELGGRERLVPVEGDVTDAAAMETLAHAVIAEHGVPDVIVANAGIGLDALFVTTGTDELRRVRVFEVNVYGVVNTVRPFLPAMITRGRGRVLFISSIVGRRGLPHYSAYSASKYALHGLADVLRVELWGSGVSIGLVCPSSTGTEFHDRQMKVGPHQRRIRPQRHSADTVAKAIVRMAGSRRRERLLSLEGRALVFVNRFSPALVDAILARLFRTGHRRTT